MDQLTTDRLLLRPISMADAADLHAVASDGRVSALSLNIPHPFPEGAAAAWIADQQAGWEEGSRYTFTLSERQSGVRIGVAGLTVKPSAAKAELGFILAPTVWGKGYATEAGREMLRFGFKELQLVRISATCLGANTASARVLEKIGLKLEARLQPEGPGGDPAFELLFYGLMREEY